MRPLPPIAVVFLMVLAGCARPASTTLTSKAGNFRVAMPGRPEDISNTRAIPAGPLTTHTFTTVGRDKITRSVSYSDLPDPPTTLDGADRVLRAGADSRTRAYQVTDQHAIEFHRHPARQVTFRLSTPAEGENGRGGFRIILVGRRLYQVIIRGPASALSDEAIADFLDSFRLIEPVDPIAEGPRVRREPTAAPAPAADGVSGISSGGASATIQSPTR